MHSGTVEQQPADSVDEMSPAQMKKVLQTTVQRASPASLRYLLKLTLMLNAEDFRAGQGGLVA